ncbi:hypothetical protein GCM10027051_13690 [Niabella terrae]
MPYRYFIFRIFFSLLLCSCSGIGFAQQEQPSTLKDSLPARFRIAISWQLGDRYYQAGWWQRGNWQYGPLSLRVEENSGPYEVSAPPDPLSDPDMSSAQRMYLQGKPYFLIKDRYQLYLIDLEAKTFAALQPGKGLDYGEDAISGTMRGLRFFDHYLLGNAVSYGLFCFNIQDPAHPRELKRYTAVYSNLGQPYFFLDEHPDGTLSGLFAQSDTLNKSTVISQFYTTIKNPWYVFQKEKRLQPTSGYTDPVNLPDPDAYLNLIKNRRVGKPVNWTIDLKQGLLLKRKGQFIQDLKN